MDRPVAVGLGIAWRWMLLYVVLSLVTQLWAGSQYSSGQGGGFAELIRWSAVFGVIAVAVRVERAFNGTRIVDPTAVLFAAGIGHLLGGVLAVWWFTSKGGPETGDWWVAPALAATCVALYVHLMAPQRSE